MTKRIIRGLAATWDLDSGGDVIVRGAFKKTLADWRAKAGRRIIPLVDQHDYSSTTKTVGKMVSAEETEEGLDCEFELLPEGDPLADALYARAVGGCINSLSIGYEVGLVTPAGNSAEARELGVRRFLKELDLIEVSAVIWPMNEEALITAVKHRQITSLDNGMLKRRIEELLQAEKERRAERNEALTLRIGPIMEKRRESERQNKSRMLELSSRISEMRVRAGLPPISRFRL